MPTIKLTPRFVRSAVCPANAPRVFFTDNQTRGLMLEVRKSGGKTLYVRYLDAYGDQRNYRIGDPAKLDLTAAREVAMHVHTKVAMGIDPTEEKKRKRQVRLLSEFALDSYLPYVRGYKRSWKADESMLRLHILPYFGNRRMDGITPSEISRFHHRLRAKGLALGTCNRALVLLRFMFNLAIKWEEVGLKDNPSRHVELFKVDNQMQRFLTSEEVDRLYQALKRSENPYLFQIVCFLLATGARKREALQAAWEDFDFANQFWLIPKTKSGVKRPIPLGAALVEFLDTLPSRGQSRWLFPNPMTGKPFVSVYYSWDTARRRAGLEDVRMHDLRHSFASFLVNSGRTIYEVQRLLGHAHVKTTERYAHLANDTLLDAVNAIGGTVLRDEKASD